MNFIARLLFGVSKPEEIDVNSIEDFNDLPPQISEPKINKKDGTSG